ncbi:MAG: hypothetical protein WCX69_01740 [Candidatus Paceibacterota bacterium]
MMDSLYRKVFVGSETGKWPVSIYGDELGLAALDKAVFLMNDDSKKNLIKDRAGTIFMKKDGSQASDVYNCVNFSKDTQEMLRDNHTSLD